MEKSKLGRFDVTSSNIINNCDVNNNSQVYPFRSLSFSAVAQFVEQNIKAVSDGVLQAISCHWIQQMS
jgi:hypothetical protein